MNGTARSNPPRTPTPTRLPEEALTHWGRRDSIRPAPDPGLINQTWLVGDEPYAVLQWVHPTFDARIHLDIEEVTARLEEQGLCTLRLIPTSEGALWIDDEVGNWRLMTFLRGRTLHHLPSPAHAAEAGAIVGRFHTALAGWHHEFHAPPRRMHDTPKRMAELAAALADCDGHPLAEATRNVGAQILADWESWDGEIDLPHRICHGDLKISNLLFDPDSFHATCLIDLDTLEPMPLACELGDALRSWCNPAGEDDPDLCLFSQEIFDAAAPAWLANAPALTDAERESIVPGIERICLELAARFAADAVRNSYFREDRELHPLPGEHNLFRARCQLNLARSAREARPACEAVWRRAVAEVEQGVAVF